MLREEGAERAKGLSKNFGKVYARMLEKAEKGGRKGRTVLISEDKGSDLVGKGNAAKFLTKGRRY